MNCVKWMENGIRKLSWYDISLIKGAVFFSTLFLLTVWDSFRNIALSIDWYWYLALAILFTISPMSKFCTMMKK